MLGLRHLGIFLFVILFACGCVYLPIPGPETQNVPDITELESLVGKPIHEVVELTGTPVEIVFEENRQHHFYIETQEFGLLIIGGPGYAVGGTLNEIYHCYRFTYDKYNRLQSVAVGSTGLRLYSDDTDCRKAFLTSTQVIAFEKEEGKLIGTLKQEEKKQIRALEKRVKEQIPRLDPMKAKINWQLYKDGSERSEKELRWLCQAADQGHPLARNEVGTIHYFGSLVYLGKPGIDSDHTLAYVWFLLADISGHESSYHLLNQNNLTYEQFEKAIDIVANWKPGQCEKDLGLKEIDEN